jgi:UDP-N-acetylmuramoyl-tripeptide--D-alanyl-D-alanine ligase
MAVEKKDIDHGKLGYGFAMSQDQAWDLEKVIEATGGLLADNHRQTVFRAVSTDSRSIEPGDLFVALRGDSFDGEKFCGDAVAKGASGVVVTTKPASFLPVPVVLVPDTLKALGDMAAFRRARMKGLKVIAITGSSGKTTVKEMTSSILERKLKIIKTKGNFNNLIGLPLSLLPVDGQQQVAVLEMGMNQPGEIGRMTEIADPDIACINNIQSAHLQGLNSIEGVAKAKGELFAGIKPAGTLVVNLEDPLVSGLAGQYDLKKITYGYRRQAMVRGTYIHNSGEGGVSFTMKIGGRKERVRLHCVGRHNVLNALAAAAMSHAVGVGAEDIRKGLEAFAPYDKRMQIEKVLNGIKVVNDTYNANPASMLAALETVQGLRRGSRSVVVLGDMLELGGESVAAHRFIGNAVARLDFDLLLSFGSFAEEMAGAAIDSGMEKDRALAFSSKDQIISHLRKLAGEGVIGTGDWILVKGSRGVRMETIIAALKEDR